MEEKTNQYFDYDNDWSEVEDLIEDMDPDTLEYEEPLVNKIFTEYGTLALVFYHRLKQS